MVMVMVLVLVFLAGRLAFSPPIQVAWGGVVWSGMVDVDVDMHMWKMEDGRRKMENRMQLQADCGDADSRAVCETKGMKFNRYSAAC